MSSVFFAFLKIFFGTRSISLVRKENGAADLAAPVGYLDNACASSSPHRVILIEVEPFAYHRGELYHHA
jgi:hypothetical protein